ncbi:hypothetical protein [Priestia sp. LL-8]|uniref:hypothetical protein n=1 Tax=Priestia sp. LL-8 TaxID=3110068 RepID=UPI002E2529CE|nr:hypothetical protein [Priestia sp. LL-8]
MTVIGRNNKYNHLKNFLTEENLKNTLIKHNYNRKQSAKKLGVTTTTLNKYLKKFGLDDLKKPPLFTKEQLEDLHLNQKLSLAEIGKMFSCTDSTVSYHLKKHNIPVVLHHIKDVTLDDILSLVEQGFLIHEIRGKLGVSRGKIYELTKNAGLNFTHHENQRKKHSKFMKENNPVPKGARRSEEFTRGFREYVKKQSEVTQLEYETVHLKDFKKYAKVSRYIAYRYYGNGEHIPDGMVIDHKYSIKQGYVNGVPAPIISHPSNLRLIPKGENLLKADQSIITLEELYKNAGEQWDPSIREIKTLTKPCEYCGKEISYRNNRKRYCSLSCSKKWRYRNHYTIIKKTCAFCGEPFEAKSTPEHPETAITCSRSCASKLHWEKRKEKKDHS